MRIAPEILDSPDDVGRAAADQIATSIAASAEAGRTFVLGCPTGRSPLSTYEQLARIVAERDLDLSRVVIALMDEYVEQIDGGYRAVDPSLAHSCVGYGERDILRRLNAGARPEHRIPEQNLWYPDPLAEDGAYDRRLEEAGGIDIFLLASGASDGHIALNPVGAPADTVTRVVALGDDTRRDNLDTFPTLRSLEEAPRFGVTVGIATIRELSRSVIMVVTGEHKQPTVRRLAAADAYEPEWPATVLTQCRFPRFLVDRSAAALLQTTL
ncbi:6-phosphogluconolactonase [Leifsonia poae]|uniref:6-phosphogluconolactonase n=1 Tax=Leifsonia poae TaxID=110933 RepID=UPI001CBEF319|nr:6-phosphogluconolactonase [Leifsonia poae]